MADIHVASKFQLNHDNGDATVFEPGHHVVTDEVASHWYVKLHLEGAEHPAPPGSDEFIAKARTAKAEEDRAKAEAEAKAKAKAEADQKSRAEATKKATARAIAQAADQSFEAAQAAPPVTKKG